jgi:hypothetical protein
MSRKLIFIIIIIIKYWWYLFYKEMKSRDSIQPGSEYGSFKPWLKSGILMLFSTALSHSNLSVFLHGI